MSVEVIEKGFLSNIQDFGRPGFASYGVPKSGVMDAYSAKIANLLVGNTKNSAVMEITLIGPSLVFKKPSIIAVAGLGAKIYHNNEPVAINTLLEVEKNDSVQIKQVTQGVRVYLAIRGGFLTEKKLKSRSMYAVITGSSGIEKNEQIPFQAIENKNKETYASVKFNKKQYKVSTTEVYKGPEFHLLSEGEKNALLGKDYSVSKNNSRMAYQLLETLENTLTPILTQPVLPGTVQLTPSGKLIILMRDCQTTGGYPRIFQLSEKSISLLSQKKAGDKLRFMLAE